MLDDNELDVTTDEPTVVSVERAIIILDLLARSPDGYGTREISRRLGYGSGTTQKILNTLRARGLVAKREDTARYALGLGAVALSHLVLAQANIVTLARPYLHRLASLTKESVYLAIRQEDGCVYAGRVLGSEEIRMDAPLGVRRPLNCTAAGKTLLAYSEGRDRASLRALAPAFASPTARSIVDVDVLFDELARVRSTGCAYDDREYNPTASCVASAILDEGERPIAAITIAGPSERVNAQSEAFSLLVMEAAEELSRAWRGDV